MEDAHELTIGQLADRSGVATSALRYYEERELIRSHRTTGNQRRYEQATLRRVAFIRAAQNVGLSLDEIGAALASLPAGRTPTKRDWHRLSQQWRPRLDEQVERLIRLRDNLDGCIGCGCLSVNGGTEAINGLIELHRRIARGFRDRDNYRLGMLLIGGGLFA